MSVCEIIGLRIRCPRTRKLVLVARSGFAIGPLSGKRHYHVRCKCGELHTAPTQSVTKPTAALPAMPIPTGVKVRRRK